MKFNFFKKFTYTLPSIDFQGPLLPTPDEQLDFFTRIWEPEPEEAAVAEEPLQSTSAEPPPGDERETPVDGAEEAKEAGVSKPNDVGMLLIVVTKQTSQTVKRNNLCNLMEM